MIKISALFLSLLWLVPLRAETVHSLLLKGNRLWVCTDQGVVRWNIHSLAYDIYNTKDGLSKDDVTSLVIDDEGMRWFGTRGGGVCRGSKWSAMECFREIDGLVSDHISCATSGSDGAIWFGSRDNGLSRYHPAEGEWQNYSALTGLTGNKVRDIFVRSNGEVWAATDQGISVFQRGGSWAPITSADGLPSNDVWEVTEGPDGTVWVACGERMGQQGGVGRLSANGEWTVYRKTDGLGDNDVRSITVDHRRKIWAGTYGGVSCFNGSSWQDFNLPDSPLADEWVNAVIVDTDDQIWLGSSRGLFRFDGERSWSAFKAN